MSSIISNTVEIMEADKGVIVLLDADRGCASFGISRQGLDQLLQGTRTGHLSASRKPGCHLSSTVKVQWASAASTLLLPALTSCISRYWIRTGRSWLASFSPASTAGSPSTSSTS
ncbi:hypothetical protein [Brevibacillus agri]|uniref:hypothetical protein n=1 Tax=Brevibacillus agri TaxID=51101 RepID=UPI001F2B84FC|nr:hypothetical protein [Brevibacillus agri]WHX30079.1 hypothetical protein QNK09_23970 [Brevibacillus agri]